MTNFGNGNWKRPLLGALMLAGCNSGANNDPTGGETHELGYLAGEDGRLTLTEGTPEQAPRLSLNATILSEEPVRLQVVVRGLVDKNTLAREYPLGPANVDEEFQASLLLGTEDASEGVLTLRGVDQGVLVGDYDAVAGGETLHRAFRASIEVSCLVSTEPGTEVTAGDSPGQPGGAGFVPDPGFESEFCSKAMSDLGLAE